MFEQIAQFSFPTTIVFGAGSIKTLPDAIKDLGIKKPIVVTDPGLVKTEAFAKVKSVLENAGQPFALFSEVHPNPIQEDVEKSADLFRKESCDGVIGLGGGSALDVAKALPVRIAHAGDLAAFEAQIGGYKKITGPLVPIIAIPTTAGTGSEVGRSSVITVPSLGRKIVIFSPLILPKRAFADPELTVGLPPLLTAANGMDAFTHNIESLTSTEFHPICDAVAVGGLELVIKYLERATKNGSDIEARGYMMIAAMMGAIAFQKDLGAAHSLAHPLSTEFNTHHGLANAVCLPAVIRFNQKAAASQYALVAAMFGVPVHTMSEAEAAAKAAVCVADLNQQLGIPSRLRDLDIPENSLPKLAAKAFQDSCHKTNPRPCTEADLLNLYREIW